MTYPFRKIEHKWQKKWEENKAHKFHADSDKPKAYVLEMLPYPSGRLHMGHVRNYSIGDAIARFYKHRGFNVLHPMGWDAFGLPAENAAMEHNANPRKWTEGNIKAMRDQLKTLGLSYDWDREVATCHPSYYGLEQKIFLDLYKKGLAYQSETWVNWDPVEHTVLANEQVVGGRGWRSGAIVEKKKLRQWSLKITEYCEELLQSLDTLDKWPEKVRKMQENWIGKSKGALIHFTINGLSSSYTLDVFSTRAETLFGASFIAIAPTHPLAEEIAKNNQGLTDFIKECQQTSTAEADVALAEKKGYKTHLTATHPLTSQSLPVFVANFVLMDYGTGAIFACPAHDERDYDFAMKYDLPIIPVIDTKESHELPYLGDGVLINSQSLNGLSVQEARLKAIKLLEEKKTGKTQITYRLRDWGISRQRYWGCPIPIIYCDHCGTVPVPEKDLPIKLPDDPDFSKPGNPLDRHPTWKYTTCPSCGKDAIRETDTFDTFVDSSWYFMRYISPHHPFPVDSTLCNKLMPVDCYIGGIEHAVLHLLYSRFFTKALRDLGYLNFDEPFKELLTQGMVCHQTFKDQNGKWVFPSDIIVNEKGEKVLKSDKSPIEVGRSEKMSKSKKNVVDPVHIIESYGADVARFFVLSDSPYDKDFDWNDDSLDGVWRYLNKIHRVAESIINYKENEIDPDKSTQLLKKIHRTLASITDYFEKYGFNKVIALHRELCRDLEEAVISGAITQETLNFGLKILLITLSPFAPHLANELWEQAQFSEYLDDISWPLADQNLVALDEITMAVQVNGKLRGSINVAVKADEETIRSAAFTLATVQRDIQDKAIRKVIIVPQRIVNIVV